MVMSDDGPFISAAELGAYERAGLCVNCFHTKECDVVDVKAGRGSCDYDKNSMEHECPRNQAASIAEYDRLVMEPIRNRLKESHH